MTRLDKLLADSGRCTRSEAKALIRAGRVTVDGATALRGEEKYPSETAAVCIDGEPVSCAAKRYLMLHKPGGILSATEDSRQRTVLDLLPQQLRRQGLFPVGRLDRDTTGLLLLTNDGDFAHRVISPKKHVPKLYRAAMDAPLDEGDAAAFAAGLTLGDGTRCLPATLEPIRPCLAYVTVYEGKYHQVKRMFAARGKHVTALHRERIGALQLDPALAPGEYRELTPEELELVFREEAFCENDGGAE